MAEVEQEAPIAPKEQEEATVVIPEAVKTTPVVEPANERNLVFDDLPAEAKIKETNQILHELTDNPWLPGIGHHIEFVGRTNSGKSRAAKEMFLNYYAPFFHEVYVMSPTAAKDNWEGLGIPKKNLITEFTEKTFNELMERAQENFMYHSRTGRYGYFTLFIFDDISNKLKSWKSFVDNLIQARHDGISIWILIQDPKFIGPAVRSQMWAHSITDQFTERKDFDRFAEGKNIPVSRTRMTPDDVTTFMEAMREVRAINKEKQAPYGRLFVSAVGGSTVKNFYQSGHELEELTSDPKYRDRIGGIRAPAASMKKKKEDDDDVEDYKVFKRWLREQRGGASTSRS